MKKIVGIFMALCMALVCLPVAAQNNDNPNAPEVYLSAGEMAEDGTVKISIGIRNTASAAPGVTGIGMYFTFDESVFSLVETKDGMNLQQEGESVIRLVKGATWVTKEQAKEPTYGFIYGDMPLGKNTITKDGVLAYFTLKAKPTTKPGTYPISIVESVVYQNQMSKANPAATGLENAVLFIEDGGYTGTEIAVPEGLELYPKDIAGHWGESAIKTVIDHEIMKGYEDGSFQPEGTVTRAEFTVALARYLDVKPVGNASFADANGHWASGYIAAMAAKGYVNGLSETEFGCNAPITREQIATILSRSMGLKEMSTDGFADDEAISSWAKEHVYRVKEAGLMQGDEGGAFQPQNNAKRAEIAAVFARLIQ